MGIKDQLITIASFVRRPEKRKLIRIAMRFRGKKGLEIGGPSSSFSVKSFFPVYLFADKIDGVNYSDETMWEGKIQEGNNYKFYNKTGHQFIREATDLSAIRSNSYDFILSCHSLEHVANPMKAVEEWRRVLKPRGLLVLVLPDKRNTFDYNRPYTTMKHLLEDYTVGIGEDDQTHIEEMINLHDFSRDNTSGSKDELLGLVRNNYVTRAVHHHVFNFELVNEMLKYFSFTIEHQQAVAPFHLVTIARNHHE
ncbi:MAG: class I SAM-dependent methyltransferase [Chitinophagaceae bacterium]